MTTGLHVIPGPVGTLDSDFEEMSDLTDAEPRVIRPADIPETFVHRPIHTIVAIKRMIGDETWLSLAGGHGVGDTDQAAIDDLWNSLEEDLLYLSSHESELGSMRRRRLEHLRSFMGRRLNNASSL